jgi:hypothetical protein
MVKIGSPLTRFVVLAIVLAVALALAVELATPREVAAAARGRTEAVPFETPPVHGCGATWIRGVTDNSTGMPLRVAQTGHLPTNQWCREPQDVPARATDGWLGGDRSGTTELTIGYLLENGDRILFIARVGESGAATVSCALLQEVRTRRDYECRAEDVASGTGIAFVRFSVLAVRR